MLRTIGFVECVVCVTWDDDLRTIKTAIPSVASNCQQLEGFQRFFEAQLCFTRFIVMVFYCNG